MFERFVSILLRDEYVNGFLFTYDIQISKFILEKYLMVFPFPLDHHHHPSYLADPPPPAESSEIIFWHTPSSPPFGWCHFWTAPDASVTIFSIYFITNLKVKFSSRLCGWFGQQISVNCTDLLSCSILRHSIIYTQV